MINRFSSRQQRLDKAFLSGKLQGARSYKRIAGYFRSSIFELVGEEIAKIPDVRILCNSELDVQDIAISKAARETALKERWNQVPVELESLLHRERYRKLYEILSAGNVEIKVVPKNKVFVHGKAGIIELADGTKTCFLGSINESRSAFAENYEILWEDTSDEGINWVDNEFEALWKDAYPLPDAIVEEVQRIAERAEVSFDELSIKDLPAAVTAESPLYRTGEELQPWQRSFVVTFLEHREIYGKVRLLLADEVGLGKTLSLATCAMLSAILGDGPVLILCPSTLVFQWQTELKDRLGIPSAVWLSNKKCWQDPHGHIIKTRGAQDVLRCPYQIAIVSTGMIIQPTEEREELLKRKYGTVILDEAHKARKKGALNQSDLQDNNLLEFMVNIGPKTRHLLIGTATPIQTEVCELWDLMRILNSGVDFVLGRESVSIWAIHDKSLPYIKGEQVPYDGKDAWELLRTPVPPANESPTINSLRMGLGLGDNQFFSDMPYSSLGYSEQELVQQTLYPDYFKNNNPIVRHTVLRRRDTLEELGLLKRIAANVHPIQNHTSSTYPGMTFAGSGLMTNHPFDLAYKAAQDFTTALGSRPDSKGATGLIESMLLQRLCSSFASGKSTAQKFLNRQILDDEEDTQHLERLLSGLTKQEASCLQRIVDELSRPEARDPKLAAVKYFLTEYRSEGKTWLEHGCIIFSQYYDTAYWAASELAKLLPNETIAVYAGLGKSRIFIGESFSSVEREDIKLAVKERRIRLVVATDAACEGLNLQTLGTLINIDLPWNPSRLEQRLGRIKRFGQARDSVDMLNLVYNETRDEKVYKVISRRLKDKHDIFGGIPDIIDDEWIDDVEEMEKKMDVYIHLREQAKNAFDMKYQTSINPNVNRWELCSKVLSRKDVTDILSEAW